MDDMRNTSAPLYGKAEPATTKTTMSVREMRQLLGLGKTDSYWLLHKNLFEVILINDKRRIVISSFEKWYANQVKYHLLLSQAQGDRQILAKQLGISPHQLSYVTHTNSGEGLLFFGNTTIPFVDRFPQNTELYAIMTTRPEDKKQEMNRA